MSLRYLTANLAKQIDEELMSTGAFSIDQLMELAGLSCAQTVAKVFPKEFYPKVLVCCGPGNQGGDGLVAARHLSQFGYQPSIFMPKPGGKELYKRLHTQCTDAGIPSLSCATPEEAIASLNEHLPQSQIILDAIFGFSFSPPVRAPFDAVLPLIASSGLPIVSVDIPSGWDVEKGKMPFPVKDVNGKRDQEFGGLEPQVLVSLTAPKLGVQNFKGRHFLGGRFVNKEFDKRHELNVPEYPGFDQIVELVPNEENQELQKL